MTTTPMLCRADIDAMLAEEDAVAATFWKYPGEDWQRSFQRKWLVARGFPGAMVGTDGRTYGDD